MREAKQQAAQALARLPAAATRTHEALIVRGEPMPGDSKENKRVPVVYRDGEFFE